jgi:N-glycosidase YbiA
MDSNTDKLKVLIQKLNWTPNWSCIEQHDCWEVLKVLDDEDYPFQIPLQKAGARPVVTLCCDYWDNKDYDEALIVYLDFFNDYYKKSFLEEWQLSPEDPCNMSYENVVKCSTHDDKQIKGFFGEYRWLSNYHLEPVMYQGLKYASSENAYQAAKFPPEQRPQFQLLNPKDSKKLGNALRIANPAQWDIDRVHVMYEILLDKFLKNPILQQKLIDTGDRYLEETNWWKDTFWGVCDGHGENNLGKVLMCIRTLAKAVHVD